MLDLLRKTAQSKVVYGLFRCTACGICPEVCAFGARGTNGTLYAEHCYGRGLCANTCPGGAVTATTKG